MSCYRPSPPECVKFFHSLANLRLSHSLQRVRLLQKTNLLFQGGHVIGFSETGIVCEMVNHQSGLKAVHVPYWKVKGRLNILGRVCCLWTVGMVVWAGISGFHFIVLQCRETSVRMQAALVSRNKHMGLWTGICGFKHTWKSSLRIRSGNLIV